MVGEERDRKSSEMGSRTTYEIKDKEITKTGKDYKQEVTVGAEAVG